MEFRGEETADKSRARPAISRRSCDQCRSRKIGCDRGSPCSNCVSSTLSCTHSAVASRTAAPKQRVLISAQYEQKIDEIAKGIDGITLLLSQNASQPAKGTEADTLWHPDRNASARPLAKSQPLLWDHSAHIINFIKTVVEDKNPQYVESHAAEPLLSLRKLVQILEDPGASPCSGFKFMRSQSNPPMPPLEAVVTVLRWAKDHEGYSGIARITEILPLETFTDICRKVYFAVDDYSEVDLILANGYLACAFSQHFLEYGLQDSRKYCNICRKNLYEGLARFPLLSPASMEVIAALTLGVYSAIETSKATTAWRFVSAASSLCLTLGYHRITSTKEENQSLRASQELLFWSVYKLDKGLSLQLSRPSNIRDDEITLPISDKEPRQRRLGRIQGKVYDQLYSQASSSRSIDERGHLAETLAEELRGLINETHAEIFAAAAQVAEGGVDPLKGLYLQCDLVCQASLLTLILRAIPSQPDSLGSVSEDCVAVARDVFDIHQKCMIDLRKCKDPMMVTQYINWAIMHIPFIPFSILFTHAVQFLDLADLERLDTFAASLKPDTVDGQESITHPHKLYELLCQAARLYVDSRNPSFPKDSTLIPENLDIFGLSTFGTEPGGAESENFHMSSLQTLGLNDWYHNNQQIMHLMNEDSLL